ncbi:Uma2 family endonuclease [Spirulina sp. 06S082]|uniref:Uma2 family endonuclease n=1 Tax=Spirulina sp. 06S082 TaxID=3110248 RepID=UPI002B1ECEBF|nr:Uma2 family endonuclease [Spirulina sp. 06S082]MEA5471882.1 Uma2 family endonuclease [Spirulina sp. 06S082]
MVVASSQLNLKDFLELPDIDESPAWELMEGRAMQKPMPTIYHSTLQKRLVALIDASESPYEAFPELRCILNTRSVVPDIAIIHQSQKPTGNVPLEEAPPWLIEILSPNQSTTKLIAKIQTCLQAGSQLGWLIDPSEQIVMVLQPQDRFGLYRGGDRLPLLENLNLSLTPEQIFNWLQ